MSITRIDSLDSPRLDPYRHLRTSNLTRFSGRFIAESKPLVERLLSSPLRTESVLIDAKFEQEAQSWVPEDIEMLVLPSDWIRELIGFNFHRGYLACGLRPEYLTLGALQNWKPESGLQNPTPPVEGLNNTTIVPLTSLREKARMRLETEQRWTGVMVIGVQDPENLGSILRTCSALGIQDVVVGPNCVDPFARRVLRVSMGNAFKLRFWEASDPIRALEWFHDRGIESISASLAADSEEITRFRRRGDAVVLFGNEAHGLPQPIQSATSRRLLVEMDLSTDSLNVSVAAGIILHNLCRIC